MNNEYPPVEETIEFLLKKNIHPNKVKYIIPILYKYYSYNLKDKKWDRIKNEQ